MSSHNEAIKELERAGQVSNTANPSSYQIGGERKVGEKSKSDSSAEGEAKTTSRRKRLLRKAPEAPKRFKSAYICYVIENMSEAKKSQADDVKLTDTIKVLAARWKLLSPEVRDQYKKMAAEDKSRYFSELKEYTGPMRIPNRRQKKPAGAPKRAMSAFLSFSQQKRHEVRAQHPDIKNTDISGILANLWKTCSEEEKAPHIDRELRDREKYHIEMEKWKEEMGLRKSEQEAIAAAAAKLEFQGSQGSHQEQCTLAGDNTDNGSQFWGKYDELVSDLAEADANNWDQLGPSSSSFEVPRSSGMMRAGEGSGMEYSMQQHTPKHLGQASVIASAVLGPLSGGRVVDPQHLLQPSSLHTQHPSSNINKHHQSSSVFSSLQTLLNKQQRSIPKRVLPKNSKIMKLRKEIPALMSPGHEPPSSSLTPLQQQVFRDAACPSSALGAGTGIDAGSSSPDMLNVITSPAITAFCLENRGSNKSQHPHPNSLSALDMVPEYLKLCTDSSTELKMNTHIQQLQQLHYQHRQFAGDIPIREANMFSCGSGEQRAPASNESSTKSAGAKNLFGSHPAISIMYGMCSDGMYSRTTDSSGCNVSSSNPGSSSSSSCSSSSSSSIGSGGRSASGRGEPMGVKEIDKHSMMNSLFAAEAAGMYD